MELDPQWRKKINLMGKSSFELQEMLRLGFVTEEQMRSNALTSEALQKTFDEFADLGTEIDRIQSELIRLGTEDGMIADIRSARIARVKAAREVRRKEQAAERELRLVRWNDKKRKAGVFLGVGVSDRLIFQGGDEGLLRRNNLPVIETIADIAMAMEIKAEEIVWLCYERAATDTDHYSRFTIPKRNGGERIISSPKPKMRKAQLWINDRILNKIQPSRACYAFRPNISIVDNAAVHTNSAVIVKLDLKDFFPSISFKRVRGFYESLGYNPGVATVLALLCTDAPRKKVTVKGFTQIVAVGERSLPQGACTSPALANLIGSSLDYRLLGLAANSSAQWRYTLYADDLTFSTRSSDGDVGKIIGVVTRFAKEEGFKVNKTKTRIMRAPRRQTVTGLVVGEDVRLRKSEIKKMRAFFHQCETKGLEVVSQEINKSALFVARGYISYMNMVSPQTARRYRSKYPWLA